MIKYITHALVLMTAAFAAGCTMADNQPPPLAGPSEMSLSLAITANPDVLSLDGSSQTLVTVEARDENGQPKRDVPLRVEVLADGQIIDFGKISARTLVTGSNGRATFTYTAPPLPVGAPPALQLSVTPTGTDASAQVRRVVTVKLVQPGVIDGAPNAVFTFLQQSGAAFTDVHFDGSASTPGLGATITTYAWEFGDGASATGRTVTHRYTVPGLYLARLTVTDSNGRVSSSGQTVTVGAGVGPTAAFVFSPSDPDPGQQVFFNGSLSLPGEGHRIVSYRWNWGDGKPSSTGSTASHIFDGEFTYVVVLTVTDEVGQVATMSTGIPVELPDVEEE